MTRYLDGSLAILENSTISSLNLGRLDGSIIQPAEAKWRIFSLLYSWAAPDFISDIRVRQTKELLVLHVEFFVWRREI